MTEAAELEHGIMCCYLFSAFSLKDHTDEGVSEEQLLKIRSWRRAILDVAIQEMVHLASACNLLTAVGGAPQLRRPNLPTTPNAYSSSFGLKLAPFSLESLEQFIAIERPEAPSADPTMAEMALASVEPRLSDIFSSERSYQTQGGLYRGIEDGIKYLAQKYGEQNLFIGPPAAQTADLYFGTIEGLIPIHNLESAMEAITVIVEQGEGAKEDNIDSHYNRFLKVWTEYKQVLEEDPEFQPARPVLTNPYAVRPSDKASSEEISLISDPLTSDVSNLLDGCYELMVQMLGRLFVHAEESQDELVRLAAATIGMMTDVIEPLAMQLTTMPAGPNTPGMNAGPSFRLSRGASIPTQKPAAWTVFRERLGELSNYCQFLLLEPKAPAQLAATRNVLQRLASELREGPSSQ